MKFIPFLLIALFLAGCGSATQTTVRNESLPYWPTPESGAVNARQDSTQHFVAVPPPDMFANVPPPTPTQQTGLVFTPTTPEKPTAVVQHYVKRNTTVWEGDTVLVTGDSVHLTFDEYLKSFGFQIHFGKRLVGYPDTMSVAPPPSSKPTLFQTIEGYLSWIGVLVLGIVIGFFGGKIFKLST